MIDKPQPESAFPSTFKSMSPEEVQVHRWGMQLRDYFAAKAMQSYWNDPEVVGTQAQAAEWAYEMADAMLKAREA